MLTELSIRNFALIETANLRFFPGLNVLTGETGAGKSIVLGALHLILGARASADLIRQGEETALVEGRFSIEPENISWVNQRLENQGIDVDPDEELIIRRVLTATNKSIKNRIYINGHLSTRANLLELARGLIDISGQREHQVLLDTENHRQILDHLVDDSKDLEDFQETVAELRRLFNEWHDRTANQSERLRRRDYLAYQIQEIQELNPQPGEDESLSQEQKRLAHVAEVQQTLHEVLQALDGEGSNLMATLNQAIANLRKGSRFYAPLADIQKILEEALINCQEGKGELETLQSTLQTNPERLNEVESRLQTLHQLQRKYGLSLAEILNHLEEMTQEFENLSGSEEDLKNIEENGNRALEKCCDVSQRLHQARLNRATQLRKQIILILKELAMKDADFKVDIVALPQTKTDFPCSPTEAGFNPYGSDQVQFLIAPNKGEGLRPLTQIASGGELSRILLALKCLLSPAESTGSYFFDEIDAGIGGVTATAVGKKLKRLSQNRQVFCITHLPQIACFADHHMKIFKLTEQKRTRTNIQPLKKDERIEELARMLGGETPSKTSRAHARELLNQWA